MKKYWILILITCFIMTLLPLDTYAFDSISQEESTEKTEEPKKDEAFFQKILDDEIAIWTSPFHLNAADAVKWLVVGILTGIMIKYDEKIYRDIKNYQQNHSWVNDWSPRLTVLGDGAVSLGICGLFYLSGMIFKDEKARSTAELSFMSLIHVALVVQIIKHLTGRQRPEVDQGIDHWEGPAGFFKRYSNNRDALFDSFPSGHTITIWSTATVIAQIYNKNFLVPLICYSLATLAGLSRITEDKHWLSDVFVGAVLGHVIARFIVNKRYKKWHVMPYVTQDGVGIGLSYVF